MSRKFTYAQLRKKSRRELYEMQQTLNGHERTMVARETRRRILQRTRMAVVTTGADAPARRPDLQRASYIDVAHFLVQKMMSNSGKNKKLGPGVASFSLPQGKAFSCPDATGLCESLCFVDNFVIRKPTIMPSYAENFMIAKRPDFQQIMTLALSMLPAGIFRIHVSGDFFSVEYIKAWASALEVNPHIKPFGFTRAWRNPKRRQALEQLGMTRYILASVDDETGQAPSGWRVAEMKLDTTIFDLKAGRKAKPLLLCDEQNPASSRSCADCGRCPGFRQEIRDSRVQLIPLTKLADVAFVLH